jgi:hypothetical protein
MEEQEHQMVLRLMFNYLHQQALGLNLQLVNQWHLLKYGELEVVAQVQQVAVLYLDLDVEEVEAIHLRQYRYLYCPIH